MMRVDILTIFPGYFDSPLSHSMLKRAQDAAALEVGLHDIRRHATDRHHTVDDSPYGGGPGMVMKPDPLAACIESIPLQDGGLRVYLTPDGEPLSHDRVVQLAALPHLVLLCGHYEGIDERVRRRYIHRELSIGDYVLTGGEPAALVLLESLIRFLPGVLGDEQSAAEDSFAQGLLDHPHYTRPPVFQDMEVPAVLLSGNHEAIRKWRRTQSLVRTAQRRPDILARYLLTKEDRRLLAEAGEPLPPSPQSTPSRPRGEGDR